MPSLYNEYDATNVVGGKVEAATEKLFRQLIVDFPDYSPREIAHAMITTVVCVESELVLLRALQKRQLDNQNEIG